MRRVAKGEGSSVEKILRRIEHRLKAQDSLAKQEIMHGRTEKTAKIDWWLKLVGVPLVFFISGFFIVMAFILFQHIEQSIDQHTEQSIEQSIEIISKLIRFGSGLLFLVVSMALIVLYIYYMLEGKKEYERRKREEEELEK